MVWTDVAFGTLTAFAVANEENALNNPLIAEALVTGHVAAQVLAIRRLKWRTALKSASRCAASRRPQSSLWSYHARKLCLLRRLCRTTTRPFGTNDLLFQMQVPRGGSFRAAASEGLHVMFDKLAGVHPTRRSREYRLPRDLFSTIGKWLDESGADELAKWASTYLAHAGGPNERTRLGDVEVTSSKSPTRSGPSRERAKPYRYALMAADALAR